MERLAWHDDYDWYWISRAEEVKLLKIRVSEAQNHRCAYCYKDMVLESPTIYGYKNPNNLATLDHYIPKFYGGPLTYDNAVAACLKCNTSRGSRPAMEFFKEKLARKAMNIPLWMYDLFNKEFTRYI